MTVVGETIWIGTGARVDVDTENCVPRTREHGEIPVMDGNAELLDIQLLGARTEYRALLARRLVVELSAKLLQCSLAKRRSRRIAGGETGDPADLAPTASADGLNSPAQASRHFLRRGEVHEQGPGDEDKRCHSGWRRRKISTTDSSDSSGPSCEAGARRQKRSLKHLSQRTQTQVGGSSW